MGIQNAPYIPNGGAKERLELAGVFQPQWLDLTVQNGGFRMVLTCFNCLKPGHKMKQLGLKLFRSFTGNMGLTYIAWKPRVLPDHHHNKEQGRAQRGSKLPCPQIRPSINSQNGQIFVQGIMESMGHRSNCKVRSHLAISKNIAITCHSSLHLPFNQHHKWKYTWNYKLLKSNFEFLQLSNLPRKSKLEINSW